MGRRLLPPPCVFARKHTQAPPPQAIRQNSLFSFLAFRIAVFTILFFVAFCNLQKNFHILAYKLACKIPFLKIAKHRINTEKNISPTNNKICTQFLHNLACKLACITKNNKKRRLCKLTKPLNLCGF